MTDAATLHRDSIIIDGLNASNFADPRVLPRLREGGVTAVNATIAAWHTPAETIHLLANLLRAIADQPDWLMQVVDVGDIARAKASGRLGVIAGFQGTDPIGDNLNLLGLYRALGVRIAQLTYDFRNLVGCGCQEKDDTGLTEFGRQVVAEMNRLGMLVDLSHCGPRTTMEAIAVSSGPVAFTHTNTLSVCPHPRNKSDAALKAVAARGGVVGVVIFPPLLTCGATAVMDDYVRMIDYMVNLIGIDHVGLGPDFMENMSAETSAAALKGLSPEALKQFAAIQPTQGFESISACANVTAALLAHGYAEADVKKIMGGNWVRLYEQVW